jgi:hypothetical protein
MPNDAVLDPTVHHLSAKDRLNRGKSSRSWPLYPRCGHDLSPPRCPPFLEAGTPDLLWLYKSQRKASEKGTSGRSRGQITNRNKKKKQEDEWKTNNTGEGRKKKNKETGGRGRNRRHTDEEKKNRDYTEKERKAEEQHRDEYWLCHYPYRKRKTHNHSKQIHSRLASSSSS